MHRRSNQRIATFDNDGTDPWELTHPGMVLSGYAESEFRQVEASLDGKKHPADWADSVTTRTTTRAFTVKGKLTNDHPFTRGDEQSTYFHKSTTRPHRPPRRRRSHR